MAKQIEETFSKKIATTNFHITGRSWNLPSFHFMKGNHIVEVYMNVQELNELAKFIQETANKISSDKDFQK